MCPIMLKKLLCLVFCFVIYTSVVVFGNAPVKAYPTSYFLNVPIEQQAKSNWCWAACGSSTVQYINGTNTTQVDFAYVVQHDYSNSQRSLIDIQNGLSFFGISSTTHVNSFTASGNSAIIVTAIPFNTIANYIYASKPLIAFWSYVYNLSGSIVYGTTNGHFIVIEGYYTDAGIDYLSYMNPSSYYMQSKIYSDFVNPDLHYYWTAALKNIHA